MAAARSSSSSSTNRSSPSSRPRLRAINSSSTTSTPLARRSKLFLRLRLAHRLSSSPRLRNSIPLRLLSSNISRLLLHPVAPRSSMLGPRLQEGLNSRRPLSSMKLKLHLAACISRRRQRNRTLILHHSNIRTRPRLERPNLHRLRSSTSLLRRRRKARSSTPLRR